MKGKVMEAIELFYEMIDGKSSLDSIRDLLLTTKVLENNQQFADMLGILLDDKRVSFRVSPSFQMIPFFV